MYNEQGISANAEAKSTPALQEIVERFEKLNAIQSEGLAGIESKLHSILNKRVPEKDPSDRDPEPTIGDAASAIGKQLMRMEHNCVKMEALYKHLTQIV